MAAKLEGSEKWTIPAAFDYNRIQGLRTEARLKLQSIQPATLGQASRISGVNPSDISLLMIYLRAQNKA